MTDNDLAPEPDTHGPVLASFLIRVTVHTITDPVSSMIGGPIPKLEDVNDLIRYQFESLTGCPVGVTSERTDV